MRVIYTSKGTGKFGVRVIHYARVIYKKYGIMQWSSGVPLKITSTLSSFNESFKYNYNNQVLVREIRLSPDVNDTCVLLGVDST
jgi:hypothetical protein